MQEVLNHMAVAGSDISVGYRAATSADGIAVHRIAQDAGGLEVNTGYAYVLLCDHFASTTLLAETDGEIVGFVAGFISPAKEDTLFVWQIGVHPRVRGLGIASSLLDALVARNTEHGVRFLEATVTPSNAASRRLFESFADRHHAEFTWSDGYSAALFGGAHEPERLIRVGALDVVDNATAPTSHTPG